jgi:hypothetical protein
MPFAANATGTDSAHRNAIALMRFRQVRFVRLRVIKSRGDMRNTDFTCVLAVRDMNVMVMDKKNRPLLKIDAWLNTHRRISQSGYRKEEVDMLIWWSERG